MDEPESSLFLPPFQTWCLFVHLRSSFFLHYTPILTFDFYRLSLQFHPLKMTRAITSFAAFVMVSTFASIVTAGTQVFSSCKLKP